ncbi:MAG TPA: helix-turn-helix domain-containing protein [Gemmatimonadales bacterium]|nr:helix-turn-helix domain-containing protein [Gemmatimonadales bacterium]
MSPREEWYRENPPPPALADCVVSLWDMRIPLAGAARVRIAPNACVDIVLYASEPSRGEGLAKIVAPPHRSYVVGSTLRAFVVRSVGWRHVIGASLAPEGVAALLGIPAAVIGESVAMLHDIIGNDAGLMEERVLDGSPEGALRRLADVLWDRRRAAPPPDATVGRAAALVRDAAGQKRMDDLTRDLDVSPRSLERKFLTHVGMSPKLFSRLVRFDRVIRDMGRRGQMPWTQFALAHGYADQAHFINEFREFAGVSPEESERENA